jgi:ATP-dependent Lon protease
MIAPGQSGSQTLSSAANRVYSDIQACHYNVETLDRKERRLIAMYRERASSYSDDQKEKINGMIQQCANGRDAANIRRLENCIQLPVFVRHLSATVEGKKLKAMLQTSGYSKEICDSIYEYVALTATCLQYNVFIGRNAPFLIGPPGVGKTRLVQMAAECLGLPCFVVSFHPNKYYSTDLFGESYSNEFGRLVEFLCQHTNRSYPIVIFFDEIDKVLYSGGIETGVKRFLLDLLNNGTPHEVEAPGANRMTISFDKMFIFLGANDVIKTRSAVVNEKNPLQEETDKIFMDRVHALHFPPYTTQEKEQIASSITTETLTTFGWKGLTDDTKRRIDDIVQKDNLPGVRVMKANIIAAIVREIARKDGWDV